MFCADKFSGRSQRAAQGHIVFGERYHLLIDQPLYDTMATAVQASSSKAVIPNVFKLIENFIKQSCD